jgi:hypothetical protein
MWKNTLSPMCRAMLAGQFPGVQPASVISQIADAQSAVRRS